MSRPNILLVILDSVRAQNTSLHGHVNETTPFLESFCSEATLYNQARAPGIWSLPSHTSIFTGYHVVEHGITDIGMGLNDTETIFEQLDREYGYRTGVFSENAFITELENGLNRGFGHTSGPKNILFKDALDPHEVNFAKSDRNRYIEFVRQALGSSHPLKSVANGAARKFAMEYPQFVPLTLKYTSGDIYVDDFCSWLDQDNGPWAACINLMDAHSPYIPKEEYDYWGGSVIRDIQSDMGGAGVWEFQAGQRPCWQRKALESLYDGAIRQTDAILKRLIHKLRDRSEFQDTLIVITSDHGEGFGEASRVRPEMRVLEHSLGIHECLLHVPLLVKYPNQETEEQISDPVSLTEFPAAVHSVLDDDWDFDAFVTENPVIAYSGGIRSRKKDIAKRYFEDISPFEQPTKAVYRFEEGDLYKYMSWGNHQQSIRLGVGNEKKTSQTACEVIESTFSCIDESHSIQEGSANNLSKETENHLENLGYM